MIFQNVKSGLNKIKNTTVGFIDEAKFREIQSSVEKERVKQDLEVLKKLQEKYGFVSF